MSKTGFLQKLIENGRMDFALGSYLNKCKDFIDFTPDSRESGFCKNFQANKISQQLARAEPSGYIAKLLSELFGIEQIYIINLEKDVYKYIRIMLEMCRHNLKVEVVTADDGETSPGAKERFKNFHNRNPKIVGQTDRHIPIYRRNLWRNQLGINAFAYLNSQLEVFEAASRQNAKRILVLDDDVFLCRRVGPILEKIYSELPESWLALNIGVSEYSHRRSAGFGHFLIDNDALLYHPVPGRTCGSFAIIYDCAAYGILENMLQESLGPYDCCALGALYRDYNKDCYASRQSVFIPDVSSSAIHKGRNQTSHAKKMGWDMSRYDEYARPIIIDLHADCVAGKKFFRNCPGLKINILDQENPFVTEAERADIDLVWDSGEKLDEKRLIKTLKHGLRHLNRHHTRTYNFNNFEISLSKD